MGLDEHFHEGLVVWVRFVDHGPANVAQHRLVIGGHPTAAQSLSLVATQSFQNVGPDTLFDLLAYYETGVSAFLVRIA